MQKLLLKIRPNNPNFLGHLSEQMDPKFNNFVIVAQESVRQDLLGVMVWYASVRNGFQYEISWDASTSQDSKQAYVSMMNYLNNHMVKK